MSIEDYVNTFLEKLPDVISPEDLVSVGIFRNKMDVCRARKKGKSPDYLQLPSARIIYTREAVAKFIRESFHDGNVPRKLGPTRSGRPRKKKSA